RQMCIRDSHELDPGGVSFYCPHVAGGVWAIRLPNGKWNVVTGLSIERYNRMVGATARAASLLTAAQIAAAKMVDRVEAEQLVRNAKRVAVAIRDRALLGLDTKDDQREGESS
ncbi:MAG: hypothetical protein QUU85_15575, partial [Candidatus Eisenbacteria bacterium]|nr:hypothetical protein [Candidatus Eisenbacteria bacterium]